MVVSTRLIALPEVAEALGVSQKALRHMVHRRLGIGAKVIRLGTRLRWNAAEVDQYVADLMAARREVAE